MGSLTSVDFAWVFKRISPKKFPELTLPGASRTCHLISIHQTYESWTQNKWSSPLTSSLPLMVKHALRVSQIPKHTGPNHWLNLSQFRSDLKKHRLEVPSSDWMFPSWQTKNTKWPYHGMIMTECSWIFHVTHHSKPTFSNGRPAWANCFLQALHLLGCQVSNNSLCFSSFFMGSCVSHPQRSMYQT